MKYIFFAFIKKLTLYNSKNSISIIEKNYDITNLYHDT